MRIVCRVGGHERTVVSDDLDETELEIARALLKVTERTGVKCRIVVG